MVPLRPYIPRPTVCFRCQGYNHLANSCEKEEICGGCALDKHEGVCKTLKCVTCGGPHKTRSLDCKKYKEESDVRRLMVLQKLSYWEARRRLFKPVFEKSYAQPNNMEVTPVQLLDSIKLILSRIEKIENQMKPNYSQMEPKRHEFSHQTTQTTTAFTLDEEVGSQTPFRKSSKEPVKSLNVPKDFHSNVKVSISKDQDSWSTPSTSLNKKGRERKRNLNIK